MRLGQILRDIFLPDSRSALKQTLAELKEEEKRLNRCSHILEKKTTQSIREATEEAAWFNGD